MTCLVKFSVNTKGAFNIKIIYVIQREMYYNILDFKNELFDWILLYNISLYYSNSVKIIWLMYIR